MSYTGNLCHCIKLVYYKRCYIYLYLLIVLIFLLLSLSYPTNLNPIFSQCTSSICGNLRFIFKCLCGRDARAALLVSPSRPLFPSLSPFVSVKWQCIVPSLSPDTTPLFRTDCATLQFVIVAISMLRLSILLFLILPSPSLPRSPACESPANIATHRPCHAPWPLMWLMLFPVILPQQQKSHLK